jgi:hypothetical protein
MAGIDMADTGPPEGTIPLTKQKQRIVVPAHKTYGIWADDKDNSGYGYGDCSIVDDQETPVQLKEPQGYTVHSESEFGGFDYEFETGHGKLTVLNCKGFGAEFSVRPLKHTDPKWPFEADGPVGGFMWLALPLIIGMQLIQFGVGMLLAWLLVRFLWKPTTVTP